MKITCVQSLAPGAKQLSVESQRDAIITIDDDSTNESGVVIMDSADSSYCTDQKSSDDQGTPDSCDPVVDSPASPSIIYDEQIENNKRPTPMALDGTESPASPDAILIVKPNTTESPASPDAVLIVEPNTTESPASPDVVLIVEPNTTESPASPDAFQVLESPLSPPTSNSWTLKPSTSQGPPLKILFDDDTFGVNPLSFTLDHEGNNSVEESVNDAEIMEFGSEVSRSGLEPASSRMSLGADNKCKQQKSATSKPLYSVSSETVLDNSAKGKKKKATSESVSANKMTCFNCLGNHTVNDCTEELDRALIAKRRREFRFQNGDNTRYHVQSLEDKYGECRPGAISPDLRSAMGLQKNQLPGHVYRMRQHGYPPGWFRNAIEQTSGLKFYGSDTVRKSKPRSEVMELLRKKLINYPGFTTPVPSGYRDEGRFYGPFNQKYTIKNIAKDWCQSQQTPFSDGQRAMLTAKRQLSQNQSDQIYGMGNANSPILITSSTLRRDSQGSQSNEREGEQNWFDDLYQSPLDNQSTEYVSADVRTMEQIYQRVILRKPVPEGSDWTELEFQGISTGIRNYRMTEQLERQDEERKKLLASQKKAEEDRKARLRKIDARPKSPSLLSPDTPTKFSTTYPPPDVATAVVKDDDVMIVEPSEEKDTKSTRSRKRPLEITLSSDDEEDVSGTEELLPNPLYKKPKLAGVSESSSSIAAGINRKDAIRPNAFKPLTSGSNTKTNTTNSKSETGKNEANTPDDPFVKKTEIEKADILNILKEHSDGTEALTYGDLPPISNFSKHMPTLPLQEEAVEFAGRFKKVLGIIRKKKAVATNEEEDDDIQIIE